MAYMRDTDRRTRGVGAIASFDHNPARQRQRLQVARGTAARDRAMAAIGRGALGLVTVNSDPVNEGGGGAGGGGGGGIYTPPAAPAASAPSAGPGMWRPDPVPMPPVTAPAPPPPKPPPVPGVWTETPPIYAPPTGSGTVGAPMGTPTPPIQIHPIDVVVPSEPDPTGADQRTKILIWGAAAAVGAYFLFFRKRGAG